VLYYTNINLESTVNDLSDQISVLGDISNNDGTANTFADNMTLKVANEFPIFEKNDSKPRTREMANTSTDTLPPKVANKFLIFENKGRGQGVGNIMNGLISCLLIAQKYARIVCVSNWDSFSNAFQSVHADSCAEILKTTSTYHRDTVQCWNFGAGCEKSCWHSAGRCELVLASTAQIVWFDGNEYPEAIFPALRSGSFLSLYTPTTALKQILVWENQPPPKTVVHLREGDDASDVRGGLDATTLIALYQ